MHKRLLKILAGIVVVVTALVMALGVYLSMGIRMGNEHFPSRFDEPFDYTAGTFTGYRAWNERRIRAARLDDPSDAVVNNLLPFLLEPDADCPVNPDGRYADGIVLIHGLIASPYGMEHLADYFRSNCFVVMAVLLPGHGTRPGDMLVSHWEEWLADVEFAVKIVSQRADRLYLSGHSVGGTLAVLEAARNPDVDALVLFAPAMMVNAVSKYAGVVSQLGRLFPGAAWFQAEPEEGIYRYESFPYRAAAETWDLVLATQRELNAHPLAIPVMTVASAQDTTVDVQATFDFMAQQTNPLSFTLLYSQFELPPYYRTQIYDSSRPDDGILGVGHLGLMTPPDQPHYGLNGAYHYCGQYYGMPTEEYARCKRGERDFYGEITEENLQRGLIERIAFNPFYNDLLDDIELFIEQVSMDKRGFRIEPVLPDPLDIDN